MYFDESSNIHFKFHAEVTIVLLRTSPMKDISPNRPTPGHESSLKYVIKKE